MTTDMGAHLDATAQSHDLTTIQLDRTYAFRDDATDKMEDWGRKLWRLLHENLELDIPKLFRNSDDFGFLRERLTNYALARLVTRGMVVQQSTLGLTEEVRQEAFAQAVDDILDVTDVVGERIVWYLVRICSRIRSNGSSLTRNQKRTIERFAATASHRCYICGQALVYPGQESQEIGADIDSDQPNWRAFEIDHIFPQKRGGGRNRENLAACCQSCNKFKDVLLSFADFALESVLTSSTDAEQVRAKFGGKNKFALLWRQRGACALCGTKFHDSPDERLFLQRRDARDVFHFLNAEVVCGPCTDTHSLKGVLLRE